MRGCIFYSYVETIWKAMHIKSLWGYVRAYKARLTQPCFIEVCAKPGEPAVMYMCVRGIDIIIWL